MQRRLLFQRYRWASVPTVPRLPLHLHRPTGRSACPSPRTRRRNRSTTRHQLDSTLPSAATLLTSLQVAPYRPIARSCPRPALLPAAAQQRQLQQRSPAALARLCPPPHPQLTTRASGARCPTRPTSRWRRAACMSRPSAPSQVKARRPLAGVPMNSALTIATTMTASSSARACGGRWRHAGGRSSAPTLAWSHCCLACTKSSSRPLLHAHSYPRRHHPQSERAPPPLAPTCLLVQQDTVSLPHRPRRPLQRQVAQQGRHWQQYPMRKRRQRSRPPPSAA